jgi:hypothetical protein
MRRAARYFAISSKKSLWRVEEERKARRRIQSTSSPAVDAVLDSTHAVAQRERQLLGCGRSRFADVVTADRDRVPPRHMLGAKGEHVGNQAHGRSGRVDVFLLRDEFLQDVVLNRPRQ